MEAVDRAYQEALSIHGRPTVIVARTIKGKGVKAVENKEGWHGKPLDDPAAAIAELGGERNIIVNVSQPEPFAREPLEPGGLSCRATRSAIRSRPGRHTATPCGARQSTRRLVALDGEVGNSTFASEFAKEFPSGTSRCTSPSSSS